MRLCKYTYLIYLLQQLSLNILFKMMKINFKHSTGTKNASRIMSSGTVITSDGIISDMKIYFSKSNQTSGCF
jgi:hypothetical protein